MKRIVTRFSMVFGLVVFLTALGPAGLLAQTNVAKAGPPANRFLFIVETSRAMQPRLDGILRAVQNLLASGIDSQLRRGDTLGIWTFNEALYAGHFPLQLWSMQGHRSICVKALTFVQEQKYEKAGRLSKVLPALDKVISDSEYITVILISSGEESMHGTPFDGRINEAYKQWRDEQQKARMPLVTVLRAKQGKITDYSVNPAPWAPEMPPLPPELLVVQEEVKQPASPKKAAPTAPPLIVHGKKAETTNAVVIAPGTETITTNTAVEAPGRGTAAAQPNTVVEGSERTAAEPAGNPVAGPGPAAIIAPDHAPTLAQRTDSAATTRATNASSTVAADTTHGTPSASGQSATAVPPVTHFNRKGVWAAGVIVAGGLLSLAVFLMRRGRARTGASLITQSLDRGTKP